MIANDYTMIANDCTMFAQSFSQAVSQAVSQGCLTGLSHRLSHRLSRRAVSQGGEGRGGAIMCSICNLVQFRRTEKIAPYLTTKNPAVGVQLNFGVLKRGAERIPFGDHPLKLERYRED